MRTGIEAGDGSQHDVDVIVYATGFRAVLTHNANDAWRIAPRVRTGNVGQNGMRTDFSLPFGGYKQSGIGREGGAQGLMSYLETKTIMLDAPPGKAV